MFEVPPLVRSILLHQCVRFNFAKPQLQPKDTDAFTHYEDGLQRATSQLRPDSPEYNDLLIFQQRLRENIAQSRFHGDTETRKAERSGIIKELNHLTRSKLGVSFNELCALPHSAHRPVRRTTTRRWYWLMVIGLVGSISFLFVFWWRSQSQPFTLGADIQASLAPGIYISRIINPPYRGGIPTKTTVWLTSKGSTTYIVDSIRLTHVPDSAMSGSSGAVPPDANYAFTFEHGSNELHALNPALVLNPVDQREVSFTLGVALAKAGSGGRIIARIYYHTSTGEHGSLLLEEPSSAGVYLSQLLGTNIKVYHEQHIMQSQIIAPSGLQRGDGNGNDTMVYIPLAFPDVTLQSAALAPPHITNVAERDVLNGEFVRQDKLSTIVSDLSLGNAIAFDICAGLLNAKCEQGLINVAAQDSLLDKSANALALRHMIQPSTTLPSFVLANASRIESLAQCTLNNCRSYVKHRLILALMSQRTGEWSDSLLALAHVDQDTCNALYAHINELDQDSYRKAQAACYLSHPYPIP